MASSHSHNDITNKHQKITLTSHKINVQTKEIAILIQESYLINTQTIALCPAKEIDYNTVVIEHNRTYKVNKTPLQLIKDACIANWSTYEGKRQAVIHHTNFRQKVPIPINIEQNIFTFPTHAPTDFECYWLFFNHISHIKGTKNPNQTRITFNNNQHIILPISQYIFKKQYERTFTCMMGVKGIYG